MNAAVKEGRLNCRDNQFDDRLIQLDTEIDIGIVKKIMPKGRKIIAMSKKIITFAV